MRPPAGSAVHRPAAPHRPPHSQLTCPAHSSPAMEATPPASQAQGRRPQATAAPSPPSPSLDFPAVPPLTPPQDCAGPAPGSAETSGLGRVLGLTLWPQKSKYPHFMLEELPKYESNGQSPQCCDEDSATEEGPLQRLPLPLGPEGPKYVGPCNTLSLRWHVKHPLTPQHQLIGSRLKYPHPFGDWGRGGGINTHHFKTEERDPVGTK